MQNPYAVHCGAKLGDPGHRQLGPTLLYENPGRSHEVTIAFGGQVPDAGTVEVIACYGTTEQQRRGPRYLFDGAVPVCRAVTGPEASSDRKRYKTISVRGGDDCVVLDWKFLSFNVNEDCRVVSHRAPAEALLGRGGQAFSAPRTCLGGDRIHHFTGLNQKALAVEVYFLVGQARCDTGGDRGPATAVDCGGRG